MFQQLINENNACLSAIIRTDLKYYELSGTHVVRWHPWFDRACSEYVSLFDVLSVTRIEGWIPAGVYPEL